MSVSTLVSSSQRVRFVAPPSNLSGQKPGLLCLTLARSQWRDGGVSGASPCQVGVVHQAALFGASRILKRDTDASKGRATTVVDSVLLRSAGHRQLARSCQEAGCPCVRCPPLHLQPNSQSAGLLLASNTRHQHHANDLCTPLNDTNCSLTAAYRQWPGEPVALLRPVHPGDPLLPHGNVALQSGPLLHHVIRSRNAYVRLRPGAVYEILVPSGWVVLPDSLSFHVSVRSGSERRWMWHLLPRLEGRTLISSGSGIGSGSGNGADLRLQAQHAPEPSVLGCSKGLFRFNTHFTDLVRDYLGNKADCRDWRHLCPLPEHGEEVERTFHYAWAPVQKFKSLQHIPVVRNSGGGVVSEAHCWFFLLFRDQPGVAEKGLARVSVNLLMDPAFVFNVMRYVMNATTERRGAGALFVPNRSEDAALYSSYCVYDGVHCIVWLIKVRDKQPVVRGGRTVVLEWYEPSAYNVLQADAEDCYDCVESVADHSRPADEPDWNDGGRTDLDRLDELEENYCMAEVAALRKQLADAEQRLEEVRRAIQLRRNMARQHAPSPQPSTMSQCDFGPYPATTPMTE